MRAPHRTGLRLGRKTGCVMRWNSVCAALIAITAGTTHVCAAQSGAQQASSTQPQISQTHMPLSPSASLRPGTGLSGGEQSNRLLDLPLDFEVNRGQAPDEYKFVAHGPHYSLGISATGMTLRMHRAQRGTGPTAQPDAQEAAGESELELRLTGANSDSEITGLDPEPGRSNYFIGNDPAKWRMNVPHFRRVRSAAVYSGIDLMFYGKRQRLEYDFAVA